MHSIWDESALFEDLKDQEEYPIMQVPANSSQSDTDVNLYGQDSDEIREEEEIIAQQQIKPEDIFDTSLVALQPFNITKLAIYPHKHKDGEVPYTVLHHSNKEFLDATLKKLTEM